MGKDEPVMTPEEAAEAEASTKGPIVAVYLLRVTLRGEEGVKAPTVDRMCRGVALAVEDIADAEQLSPDYPIAHASVTGERVDK